MSTLRFQKNYPKIIKMASGHLSLELSDQISFDSFPEYAELFLSIVGGSVIERGDSIVMCIWDVVIDEYKYRLVYDDYPCGVSLESDNDESDGQLIKVKETLIAIQGVRVVDFRI